MYTGTLVRNKQKVKQNEEIKEYVPNGKKKKDKPLGKNPNKMREK